MLAGPSLNTMLGQAGGYWPDDVPVRGIEAAPDQEVAAASVQRDSRVQFSGVFGSYSPEVQLNRIRVDSTSSAVLQSAPSGVKRMMQSWRSLAGF
ncbi:hypothetical protein VTO73DRAFT_225 [Trametes versicolor]